MARRTLVVTEKFSTALRIAIVLSDGRMERHRHGSVPTFRFTRPDGEYVVVGLRGHIVELDYPGEHQEWSLEGLPGLIAAEPFKRVTEPGIVRALQEIVPEVDRVILATDFDREGELIGLECLELLEQTRARPEVRRARYSALTREEIERSFSNLSTLDRALAAAGESRQVIDLVWGAALTRYLSITSGQRGRQFLSAGRVQTPTLALLVERDQAIKEFVASPFWTLRGTAAKAEAAFPIAHEHGAYTEHAEAETIYGRVRGATQGTVLAFVDEELRRRPPVPFSTTLFVAEATRLGLGAAVVMRIAEDLYTQGLISYPRTDNTVYPRGLGLKGLVERLRESPFREEAEYILAQPTFRATRGRTETTDHPPIYPTSVVDPKKLKPDHARVYELVVRRFLATVSPDAVGRRREVTVEVAGERFVGQGSFLTERGWYRVYPYSTPEELTLPVLEEDERVAVRELRLDQEMTKPPRRYSQGSLIQEMERLGLGTKSTRHDVLQKLFDRHYVSARQLEPTGTGVAVTEALEAFAPVITRPEMTHRLEEEMELVANSKKERDEVIRDSREMLREAFDLLLKNSEGVRSTLRAALDRQHFVGPCARCGGALRLARSPGGGRWVQCVNNPGTCTVSYALPRAGFVEPAPEFLCGNCRVPRVKIVFRGQRPELFCINPECPEHAKAFRFGECPSCGKPLALRYSFAGKRFVGCTGYPDCRVTYPLPQRGKLVQEQGPCPVCRAPVVTAIEAGRPPWVLCINPACPTREKPPSPAKATRKGKASRRTARQGTPSSAPARRRKTPRSKRASEAPELAGDAAAPAPAP